MTHGFVGKATDSACTPIHTERAKQRPRVYLVRIGKMPVCSAIEQPRGAVVAREVSLDACRLYLNQRQRSERHGAGHERRD